MSLAAPTLAPAAAVKARTSYKAPIAYGVVALLALLWMPLRTPAGDTTFRLSSADDFFQIPQFALAAAPVVWVLVLVAVALAALSFWLTRAEKPVGLWLPVVFAVALVLAFLTFVGAGNASVIPLTSIATGSLFLATPLIFGALAGVLSERVGIVNIAIEGQLLAGAFLAAVIGSVTTSAYLGLVAAPVAGALVGMLLVFFSVRYHVNQVIVGVVLNVLVVGLTSFLFSTVLAEDPATWNSRTELPELPIPVLSQIPVLGPILFRQTLLVYLMYVIVIALQVYLFRSRWGLRVRAVGEHPKAADTVGIDVNRTRVRTTVLASAIAGLGGAFFTVASGLAFGKEMTGGRGFIALAAVILGRWSPKGAVAAALLFGFAENLRTVLGTLGSEVPPQFLLMVPYVVTILAVAGFAGRVRAPAAEGIPYVK
ncbi:ABC transporter permease [Cellulomonas oligotrophica]|uniref:ABC transporter permease n=1 Tax=Cellulomonas oligotrophica TaxID=931536 RepID=A0A7Y9JZ74_9CELL|nr:ABC transporter permease [Cellulomonas oligotrophica]NYD87572.1 simple sugar transport system permease protein [Cellulomonas oligotrophica]GIG33449.1 ABC transporter permease [Cellulomonas oligotrophica]